MLRILAALLIPLLILIAYRADAENVSDAPGRFTLNEVEGGFLRLDTVDGRVSLCHRKGVDWVCELVADDREAFDAEIGRLIEENSALRDDLAALKRGGGNKDDLSGIELPSREDIDRVMAFFDQMMRRFFDMVKSLQEKGPRERT